MGTKETIIQDLSLGVFNISSGSNREGYLVTFDTSPKTVKLAQGNSLSNCPVIGAIVADNSTKVRIRRSGQIRAKLESGLTIGPGEYVWLSTTEPGKITNVPPTSGIMQQIGITEGNKLTNDYIRITFFINHIVILN